MYFHACCAKSIYSFYIPLHVLLIVRNLCISLFVVGMGNLYISLYVVRNLCIPLYVVGNLYIPLYVVQNLYIPL